MALIGAVGALPRPRRFTARAAPRARSSPLSGPSTAAGRSRRRPATPGTSPTRGCRGASSSSSARARPDAPRRAISPAGGVAIAMLVYAGGIYPLPHTVLLLGVYALLLAIAERSARPLVDARPRWARSASASRRPSSPAARRLRQGAAPHRVDRDARSRRLLHASSPRAIRPSTRGPRRVTPYGWHEWGIYIGAAGVAARSSRASSCRAGARPRSRLLGVLFVALGFGAFHPERAVDAAPQALARLPLAARALALPLPGRARPRAGRRRGGLGRFVQRRGARRALARRRRRRSLVLALGVDVALVAQKPMTDAMWMVPPDRIPQGRPSTSSRSRRSSTSGATGPGPMYLAMLGNTGVINCYGAPPFDAQGRRAARDRRLPRRGLVEGARRPRRDARSPSGAPTAPSSRSRAPRRRAARLQHELRRGLAARHDGAASR